MTEENQQEEKKPEKYAFFIGCTIQYRAPYIEKLAREIFKSMGIGLADLDFVCCPTSRIARDVDIDTWLLIAARNLATAEKEGLPILSMCTGCTQTLVEARHKLEDIDTRKAINAKLKSQGLEYKGISDIKFYAQLIHEKKDSIKVLKQLPLKIATHSGCHILRPSKRLQFDDPENPVKLDQLVAFLGADPVDYRNKSLCCGFPIYDVDEEAANKMMRDKLAGLDADLLTVVCPTCFEYYELRQKHIADEMGFKPILVMHYLQVLGLAMGMTGEEIGYENLRLKDDALFRKIDGVV
jgi:heterodisulfide reductase subunit B